MSVEYGLLEHWRRCAASTSFERAAADAVAYLESRRARLRAAEDANAAPPVPAGLRLVQPPRDRR